MIATVTEAGDPPDYTGQESDPKQAVSVWEVEPGMRPGFDFMWFRTRDAALDHIGDEIVEKATEALDGQLNAGDEEASFCVKVRRLTTTAEEADAVFEDK